MQSKFDRLYTVELFKQVDHNKDLEFQNIVRLAAEICETPVALLTLLDNDTNWFKASVGVDVNSMPKETSFCQYTVQQEDLMIVEDATMDTRFAGNPLVHEHPRIRFYAGAALTVSNGDKVGSLCVIDVRPKTLTAIQQRTLEILSKQATFLMELQLSQTALKAQIEEIEARNKVLMNISQVQSHDFRRPLASILGLINIIKEENYVAQREYLEMIDAAAQELDEKIHLIVEYTQLL